MAFAIFAGGSMSGWLLAVYYLFLFFVLNFYFIWLESRSRGSTPGKKRVGIRVMDAHAGNLTLGAIVTRNLMRQVEVFLPLAIVFNRAQFWPGASGIATLGVTAWIFVLLGLPRFNRLRMRAGDMLAGTIVVYAPKVRLLSDLHAKQAASKKRVTSAEVETGGSPPTARFVFSETQLDAYGAYELQVLEDVLRKNKRHVNREEVLGAVAERIAEKIAWTSPLKRRDRHEFLLAYYSALRAHLERKMLMGRHKKDKHS